MVQLNKAGCTNPASSDAMFGGAVARSLLAEHEGYEYEPEFILPLGEYEAISKHIIISNADMIYPNPANSSLYINWHGQKGMFILSDITGRPVMRMDISSNFTKIDISTFRTGIYIAQIKAGDKTLYTQKIVKQ